MSKNTKLFLILLIVLYSLYLVYSRDAHALEAVRSRETTRLHRLLSPFSLRSSKDTSSTNIENMSYSRSFVSNPSQDAQNPATSAYSNTTGTQPYPEAPSCEEKGLEHNPTAYHGVWDFTEGCYWDHTHNADPHELESLFGEWPFPNLISYPHETMHENEMKHEGYKWYNLNTNGECVSVKDPNPDDGGCVTAMRIQYHTVGSEIDTMMRFHSFYAQVQVRNPDGSFGYISNGGWADFGILHNPYKNTHCPLESDPAEFNLFQPPYRALHNVGITSWNSGTNGAGKFSPYNRFTHFDFVDYDNWTHESSCASYADEALEWVCDDPAQCENNHSRTRFYEVVVQIPSELKNGGKLNYSGFTDKEGFINESCSELGPDCVPLEIENVDTIGGFMFRVETGGAAINASKFPYDEYAFDFDISPQGKYWIQYPN